jgi:hypothetical protein
VDNLQQKLAGRADEALAQKAGDVLRSQPFTRILVPDNGQRFLHISEQPLLKRGQSGHRLFAAAGDHALQVVHRIAQRSSSATNFSSPP